MAKALEIRAGEEGRSCVDDGFIETTEGLKSTPWAKLEHGHSSLHIYLKLLKRGVSKERAYRISNRYEENVQKHLGTGVKFRLRYRPPGNTCRVR